MKLKIMILGRFTIKPNGVATVKTKQKSPSSQKGFHALVSKIVEVWIYLL